MNLKNANGDISAQGLACGYIQVWRTKYIDGKHTIELTLKQIEGGAFQVLAWSNSDSREIERAILPSVTEARRIYGRFALYLKSGIMY